MIGIGNSLQCFGQSQYANMMRDYYAQMQDDALYQQRSCSGIQAVHRVIDTRTELRRDLEEYLKDWKD